MNLDRDALQAVGTQYGEALGSFKAEHQLPDEWFVEADHLAVKCRDGADYDATLQLARNYGLRITEVEMNGRRLATVELDQPLQIAGFGVVTWLEVMEPRPEKVGVDRVGTDHAEFYFPDFQTVEAVLGERQLPYQLQSNPSHRWVSLPIDARGLELKLNNGTLASIVEHELADGLSRVVWERG